MAYKWGRLGGLLGNPKHNCFFPCIRDRKMIVAYRVNSKRLLKRVDETYQHRKAWSLSLPGLLRQDSLSIKFLACVR